MKVLLIAPAWRDPLWARDKKQKAIFPPLNLAIVASLTPEDVEVSIIDENLTSINDKMEADLVGITAMTALAPRAYQIAEFFRARGSKVVMGGIHASAKPEEAAQHVDAVAVGEAEATWPQIVEDFRKGRLQRIYKAEQRPSLLGLQVARRNLLHASRYLVPGTLQTTRGCPFACTFCSVTTFFGRSYRFRPVAEVVREVAMLPSKLVAFVDDNIIGNIRYAKELFRALTPLKIKWFSQGSLNLARDPELMDLAAASGCIGMFIGFESLSESNLKEMRKKQNDAETYAADIDRLHRHGLAIEGAFVFGLDGDDEDVFERTVSFARESKLEAAQFGILTPFPGTPLYDQLERENRITKRDWSLYDVAHVVFQPKRMSPQTLQEGNNWAWKEFYSVKSIYDRLGIFRPYSPFLWALNWNIRKRVNNFVMKQALT